MRKIIFNSILYVLICSVYAQEEDFAVTPMRETETDSASIYFWEGFRADNREFYELALEYYQKAISIDPNDSDPYVNMGNAYYKQGNTQLQIKCYKRAAQLGDTDAQNWLRNNGYSW
jgi:tetratricopeptide (TPR) repeat protein